MCFSFPKDTVIYNSSCKVPLKAKLRHTFISKVSQEFLTMKHPAHALNAQAKTSQKFTSHYQYTQSSAMEWKGKRGKRNREMEVSVALICFSLGRACPFSAAGCFRAWDRGAAAGPNIMASRSPETGNSSCLVLVSRQEINRK